MKLVVESFNLEHAHHCINQAIDIIVIGNDEFATRISYSFKKEEIESLIKNKNKTKIWIKVNAIFFEQDIDKLTQYLKWLSTLAIERVIFQDLAVAQINDELNLNLNLHYCPETLITSYGQLPFYNEASFKSVFLARELTIKEIEEICRNKNNLEVEIQGHGYLFVMHSRWKMITNFMDHYDLNDNNYINKNYLLVCEELRKYNNILFEDKHGTHMLTGYMIYTIDMLNKLKDIGIDYLKLDFIKTDYDYACKITDLYQQGLINNNNKLNLTFKELNKNYVLTHNFLGGINEIYGLKKDDENE